MPYYHADKTPCAGPLLCAFRDSAGHESNYHDEIAEPPLEELISIEHGTRDASAAQQLLAFKLVHRGVQLLSSDAGPHGRSERSGREWALWEQHARVLLRTMEIEPPGEMPAIPDPTEPEAPGQPVYHPRHATHLLTEEAVREHLSRYHASVFPSQASLSVLRTKHVELHQQWDLEQARR